MRSPDLIAATLAGPLRLAVLDSRKDDYGDGWINIRNNGWFDRLQSLGLTSEPSGQRLTPLGFEVRSLLERNRLYG